MKLTSEQKNAVLADGCIAITACPGSGKTRVICAKILSCIDDIINSNRQLCCITYTRAAVDEVNSRIYSYLGREDYKEHLEIGTIHSFCLNNILRTNYFRHPDLASGFSIMSPDDEEYNELVDGLLSKHGIQKKYKERFETLSRGCDPKWPITPKIASEFWESQIQRGLLDFDGIVYYSAELVERHKFISRGLAAKFSWFLMDEFQDTTDAQIKILRAIAAHKTTAFFIVGDPYQSIFGFAGAKPEYLSQFASEIDASEDFHLTGNFRSSDSIINLAENHLTRSRRMTPEGKTKSFNHVPVWYSCSNIAQSIKEHFVEKAEDLKINLNSCAIIGPNFYVLRDIARKLRALEVPVLGPGARPYKRSQHLIAPLIEELCADLDSLHDRRIGVVKNRLMELVQNCEGNICYELLSFKGDLIIAHSFSLARNIRQTTSHATDFLIAFSEQLAKLLFDFEVVSCEGQKKITDSGPGMVADILQALDTSEDIKNYTVEDLGVFGGNQNRIRMINLHKVKGREYDAVAMVNTLEGNLPYGSVSVGSEEEEAARRLFYVGVTRARKALMFFTDKKKDPSRFLHAVFPHGPIES